MSAFRPRARRAGSAVALSATALATLTAYAAADGSTLGPTATRSEATALAGATLARFQAPVQTGVAQPDSATSFDATLPNGRRVTPAGLSVHVGENPLGAALTPDGRYLVVSNDDERNTGKLSTAGTSRDATNGAGRVPGGFVLTVVRTSDMSVVSNAKAPVNPTPHPGSTIPGRSQSDKNVAQLFAGVLALPNPDGTSRVYAAGGASNTVDEFAVGTDGTITSTKQISVPVPKDSSKPNYGMATPGGLALGPDGHTAYVVLDNGDAVTTLDTTTDTISPSATPVGHFPYAATVAAGKLFVSNWGVADRHFADGPGTVGADGTAAHTDTPFIGGGTANRFATPTTDDGSSSLSVLDLAGSGAAQQKLALAPPVDGLNVVGGTHPSALATATRNGSSVVYVADANDDTVAIVDAVAGTVLGKLPLPQPAAGMDDGQSTALLGLVPNALATSPDGSRLYVAEAGVNSVAVFDTSTPTSPRYLGRIPTGWYPTALTVSADGGTLYVTNSKGAGSPYGYQGTYVAPGTYSAPDVNLLFGSVQKVDLASTDLGAGAQQVLRNNVAPGSDQSDLVSGLQANVKHVVYILRENKTYDTYLGNDAVLNARGANGSPAHAQYGNLVPNLRKLAETYAVGDNAYADAEESDAGHSFALAGTSTDYQQKTLLSRFARGFINTKNEDPEDYPLRGYLFENMARHHVSYRDYGDMIRVSGYDEGSHPNPCADDPYPGCATGSYGFLADKASPTAGLGGRYSTDVPALASLAGHVDESYPGWNLRISDSRRAQEFVRDYSAAVSKGTAPQFTFLWLPTDHTGGCGSPTCTPTAQVTDADNALGTVMNYLTHSPVWSSSAVFLTEDDAQGSPDHVAAHRSFTVVASPFAKKGYVSHRLSSTVSVAKTIEEILGLPAMNVGDATANDLLDYFDPNASGSDDGVADQQSDSPAVPAESQRIAALMDQLDNDTYDADNARLGQLDELFSRSLDVAAQRSSMSATDYQAAQDALYASAQGVAQNG